MGKLPFEEVQRDILVRQEAGVQTQSELPMDELIEYGIVNVDKPKGPTSHQTAEFVKKIFGLKKAGHSGTLDPGVTGVLPCAIGKATRITQALLPAGKEYVALMYLHQELDEQVIRKAFDEYKGKIMQMPPVKSAVRRILRPRSVYYIDIIEIDGKHVLFRIGCEAGTYIRKYCLHPDTTILTDGGAVLASDFYLNPLPVYSLRQGNMIKKKSSATQKLRSPSKLLKITMTSGIDFTVTKDHEMLVSKDYGYEMIEAQKLRNNDYLVRSFNYPESDSNLVIADLLDDDYLVDQSEIKELCKEAFLKKYGSIRAMYRDLKIDRKAFLSGSKNAITIRHLKLSGIYSLVKKKIYSFKTHKGSTIAMKKLDTDFFYLLGLIASDGNNTKEKNTTRHTRIKFHNNNESLVDTFITKYQKIFPEIPISKKKVTPKLFQLDTLNSFLATIAASLGIKSPQKNSCLLSILNVHPSLIRSFIKGCFDGDGSAYFKKKKSKRSQHTSISLHTASYEDAKTMHKMLLKIQIPNRIFYRRVKKRSPLRSIMMHKDKYYDMYEISIKTVSAQKKFIIEVGSEHSFKLAKFDQIMSIKNQSEVGDQYYVPLHFKKDIKIQKSKLHSMGGNLSRVITGNIPLTRGFYKKASSLIKLPHLDDFIIEKIKSIEEVDGTDFVYDMTVPKIHNFLIESGFVSSNCHDLGRRLGCGAHMAQLRRSKVATFDESTAYTLQDIADAVWYYKHEKNETFLRKIVQPIETGVRHLGRVWALDSTLKPMSHGRDLAVPGIVKVESDIVKGDLVAVMSMQNTLVSLGIARLSSEKMVSAERGIAVTNDKVFLPQ
mgnify:CR=1 FL=1